MLHTYSLPVKEIDKEMKKREQTLKRILAKRPTAQQFFRFVNGDSNAIK